MSEMVERVAKAIAISGNGGTWDDWYNEEQREFHRRRARAAIKALLEPTQEMIDVTKLHPSGPLCWQGMIWAALK